MIRDCASTSPRRQPSVDRAPLSSARALLGVILLSLLAFSCAGRVDMAIQAGGGARITLKSEFPPALAARIRDFGKIPQDTYLFDAERAKASLLARPGVKVESISSPTKESIQAFIDVSDLSKIADDKDVAEAAMVKLTKDKTWTELKVTLSRANARQVYALAPGVDDRLMDALSPPALEEDPVTPEEYRMNLESAVVGKKAMPAFDQAGIDISLKAPNTIIASSGGRVTGTTMAVRIRLFDILTLDKPIEFWLRWKN